jgi:2-dehydro-3-deoxygalactonokinase
MTRLIGVDWGTTNLRAYRFDGNGAVIERRSSPRGAATLSREDYAEVLVETVGDWSDGATTPIVLAGMVGSRNGWREAPYLPCPVDPAGLASAGLRVETPIGAAVIVPGVSVTAADAIPSVMRGEETQLFGAGTATGSSSCPAPIVNG